MFLLREIQTLTLFGFFIKKNNVSVMPRRYNIRKVGLQFPSVCAMLINWRFAGNSLCFEDKLNEKEYVNREK